MKYASVFFIIELIFTGIYSEVFGQDQLLSAEQAVKIALEKNYDIKISLLDIKVAENNAGVLNSNYILPKLTSTSNLSAGKTESEVTPSSGFKFDGGITTTYSGNLRLDYTLLNIFSIYNFYVLQKRFGLSKIQARSTIETTLTNIYTTYYQVALLSEKDRSLRETLELSTERFLRAQYSRSYGQIPEVDVLKAAVDLNTDSTAYLQNQLQLDNNKRNLSQLLGDDTLSNFRVDTSVLFTNFKFSDLLDSALQHNASLLISQKNTEINETTMHGSVYFWVPVLSAYGTLSYRKSAFANDPNNRTALRNQGYSFGVSLSWNLFDGSTLVKYQNAKLNLDRSKLQENQALQMLKVSLKNGWQEYQNALFAIGYQKKNLRTNQLSFLKAKQQYQLGQISSIDFRISQINLLNATQLHSQAKYNAKNAEIKLLRLAGILVK